MPLADHDVLIKRRKEELKHAQDVKELYQRKLEKVNDLYLELSNWKLQLEQTERALNRRERQLNIQSSKIHYKKKLRPFLGKTPDRFQPRSSRSLSVHRSSRQSSPSTPEVLSTSPDPPDLEPSPFKLKKDPTATKVDFPSLPSHLPASTPIVVRENPGFDLRLPTTRNKISDRDVTGCTSNHSIRFDGNCNSTVITKHNLNQRGRVRALS